MTSNSGDPSPALVDVLVIGAGMAGVALAANLRRRRVSDFVVLDMGGGIGGTWWDNRYPGAEVDVTSELYSFSFAPHVFSRTHAGRDELHAYIESVVDRLDLRRHFLLNTKVETVEWTEAKTRYLVTAADGRRWSARHVVSAVGQLNNPRYASWPGLEDFSGAVFHTARWDDSVTLAGRRVAIVGTGSTSAQAIPEVAKVADHLYVFQRQPGWVVPKLDRDYPPDERLTLTRRPWQVRYRRAKAFVQLERMRAVARAGTRANRRKQRLAEDYLRETVADPALRDLLTPDYPFYGKRPVLTQYYFQALQRDNVTLVPRAVQAVTGRGLVDSSGSETPVDVIITALGFQPSRFLATFKVTGRGGVSLDELWGDEPKAFLGLMAEGFPNFFVTYGPNTNGGTLSFTLERQAEWISTAVAGALRNHQVLDVAPSAVRRADAVVARANLGFVWATTGNNYYTSGTGRVVTQWPFTQTFYWVLLRLLRPSMVCRHSPAAGPAATPRSRVLRRDQPRVAGPRPESSVLTGSR